ncbi:DNA-packaging protein [Altererythrobacter sp. MF3-039]|uniref:DNA-packaging protein n=1 Tax=Altererythrobacter sp. MF3-039 TaxID=3252901 RepID=UPI00390CCAFC
MTETPISDEEDRRAWMDRMNEDERRDFPRKLTAKEREEFDRSWHQQARDEQLPPPEPWRIWLIMAGRGFGKTRAGAEWVLSVADADPHARIALVASSLAEARAVMVEGESGILACSADNRLPTYEPSLRRITFNNGAQALLYSAAEPEALRGPQHSHAWCDELGKWPGTHDKALRCWDNLLLGLRLGEDQKILATTTPRTVQLMQRLMDEKRTPGLVMTRGKTRDNAAHLPQSYLDAMRAEFGDSALGRQELHGELLEDIEGALWSRALLERCRDRHAAPEICRIVIGVDPPASASGDACGIIVAGIDDNRTGFVLADCSVEKASPEKWARAVADAARIWNADRVVAEANQGGAMVESVLRAAEISLPVKLVHASRGKSARAEPVAALYEAGRVRHAEMFGALEDELCGLMVGGAYEGPGRSPDRADALVWALTELMLSKAGRPKVRQV